jgi:hypothetical protein
MLGINLIVIGLMIEKIFKADNHVCKTLAIAIISILTICIIAECLFIYYDATVVSAIDSDDLFVSNPSHIFNGAFGIECAMVAPVGLICLITSIKTVRHYITK